MVMGMADVVWLFNTPVIGEPAFSDEVKWGMARCVYISILDIKEKN